jgi:hypothetical protein
LLQLLLLRVALLFQAADFVLNFVTCQRLLLDDLLQLAGISGETFDFFLQRRTGRSQSVPVVTGFVNFRAQGVVAVHHRHALRLGAQITPQVHKITPCSK